MKKGLLAVIGGLAVAGAGVFALTRKNSEEEYTDLECYDDEEVEATENEVEEVTE